MNCTEGLRVSNGEAVAAIRGFISKLLRSTPATSRRHAVCTIHIEIVATPVPQVNVMNDAAATETIANIIRLIQTTSCCAVVPTTDVRK